MAERDNTRPLPKKDTITPGQVNTIKKLIAENPSSPAYREIINIPEQNPVFPDVVSAPQFIATTGNFQLKDDTDLYGQFASDGTDTYLDYGGKLHIRNGSGGVNKIAIDSDGKLGIGTTVPTAKLQVVGIAEYADNAAALTAGLTAGAFYRTGDVLKIVH